MSEKKPIRYVKKIKEVIFCSIFLVKGLEEARVLIYNLIVAQDSDAFARIDD